MIGPILHQELLLGSRRNKLHVLRWIYAGWLILQVLFLFLRFQAEESSRLAAAPSSSTRVKSIEEGGLSSVTEETGVPHRGHCLASGGKRSPQM